MSATVNLASFHSVLVMGGRASAICATSTCNSMTLHDRVDEESTPCRGNARALEEL
jgi:hypothetical protein